MRTIRILLPALVCFVLFLIGCGDDNTTNPPGPASYTVSVTGLLPLVGGKGHYEAWIAFPASAGKSAPTERAPLHGDLELISIGKFRVDGSGNPVALDGGPAVWALRADRNPQFAAEGWISIEPEADADTIPEGLLLAGEFLGTAARATASLSVGYKKIFDLEESPALQDFGGKYVLETPSDGDPTDETHGLFWRSGLDEGLDIPHLDGEKIVYECWIENLSDGATISTGRFHHPDSLDSDGAGHSGGGAVPQFPGQEFLSNPSRDLASGVYRTFLTLEPRHDNDPAAPTQFVILSDTIDAGTPPGDPGVSMQNVTAALPTATIVIDR